MRICSVLNGSFCSLKFKPFEFKSTKLQLAHKSWSLEAHFTSIHHSCEQLHITSFLASYFWIPPPSISAFLFFFPGLTPPCCHNDSNLWSRLGCRCVSDDSLAGTGWSFCMIGRKWLMSSLNAVQEILQKMSTFSAKCEEADIEIKRSKNTALRDSPWPSATVLSLSLSPVVNRWLVKINGCLPTQLSTNSRCIWPSCVNSSEHHNVSTPLCESISSVIAHQLITTAIHLQWFYSHCYMFLLFFKDLQVSNHLKECLCLYVYIISEVAQ